MVEVIKSVIKWKLKALAAIFIRLNKIEIIAITGSAGKTTVKTTLRQILPASVAYVPEGAYNTEYGVPLALFNETAPQNPKDLLAWLSLLWRMFFKLLRKSPYQRIVLEYGADKPGDIEYLVSFAKPHISIITTILPVHIEGFGSVKAIEAEKGKLVESLSENDFAVLNYDDPRVKQMAKKTKARVISFGAKGSGIQYMNLKYNNLGMAVDLLWKGTKYPVVIPVLAPQLLPSFLAAFSVGIILGEDPKTLAKKLSHILPEKGRMNILSGQNESIIIDDSYNSNPESAKAALGVLSQYSGRKIAVLGSMNELGSYAEKGHKEVAIVAAEIADIILTVGSLAGELMYPVLIGEINNKKTIKHFNDSREAGEYLKAIFKKGDVILFKGSQNGVFIEEAIKAILKDPNLASEKLVRQGEMWQKKKGFR